MQDCLNQSQNINASNVFVASFLCISITLLSRYRCAPVRIQFAYREVETNERNERKLELKVKWKDTKETINEWDGVGSRLGKSGEHVLASLYHMLEHG